MESDGSATMVIGYAIGAVLAASNPAAEVARIMSDDAAEDRSLTQAAQGRRLISAAFVRMGPDRRMTVTLHGGRELILQDVTIHAQKYCGLVVADGQVGARHCGGYAEIAGAAPGGGALLDQPDLAAPNPLKEG